MRYLIITSVFCIVAMSCKQNNVRQKQTAFIDSPAPVTDNISGIDTAAQASPAQAIKEIRAEYARINALQLIKESFKWEANGCVDEGVINYFFSDGKILKIVETGSIGDEAWVTEYYYKNGKFIFSHDVLTGGPAAGPQTKKELRTYVRNDTIVQSIENKTIIAPVQRLLSTASKEYKILSAYQTKDFEGALCD